MVHGQASRRTNGHGPRVQSHFGNATRKEWSPQKGNPLQPKEPENQVAGPQISAKEIMSVASTVSAARFRRAS
jgi:hypothetical protein